MPENSVILLIAAAVAAAALFFQRLTGFGSAILATPVLALFWLPHSAINLLLIYQALFGIVLISSTWRMLARRELRLFLFTFVPALITGAYILPGLSDELVRNAIAVVVFSVLIQWLLAPKWRLEGTWANVAAVVLGVLSGGIQGAFGTGGPFFLAYYGSVEKRSSYIRDASIAVFFVGNTLRLPVAAGTAQLTEPVLWAALFTLPLFALAMLLGGRLAKHFDDGLFRWAMVAILTVAAINLLLR